MARLVDADKIVQKLKAEIEACPPPSPEDGDFERFLKRVIPDLLGDVIQYIENQPTWGAHTPAPPLPYIDDEKTESGLFEED